MPEPDFDQIARDIAAATIGKYFTQEPRPPLGSAIAAQLRQVWNARGAADLDLRTAVETVVQRFTADEAQGYHSRDRAYAIEVLGRALRGTVDV